MWLTVGPALHKGPDLINLLGNFFRSWYCLRRRNNQRLWDPKVLKIAKCIVEFLVCLAKRSKTETACKCFLRLLFLLEQDTFKALSLRPHRIWIPELKGTGALPIRPDTRDAKMQKLRDASSIETDDAKTYKAVNLCGG